MANKPISLRRIAYEEAAEAYLRGLPPEHFMESTSQAQQRKITLESLDLVALRRPEVQVFNELLVQYPVGGSDETLGQVVPDNMVVIWPERIKAEGSFDVPFQPVGPFWVLEYVSKSNKRKDYEDNLPKYERDLKVPYYLMFYPDIQELTLYRRNSRRRYVSQKPNENERYGIPELNLEVAILDGWVRFWLEGQLLPLPADIQRDLDEARRQARHEKRRADEEKRRADEEKRRADEEKRRADEEKRRSEEMERELIRLRAELERLRS